MLKHHPSILLVLLCLTLVLDGCRPLYRASIPNQPVFTGKNQAEMEVGLETGTAYGSLSYSVTDQIYITGSTNAWFSNHTTSQFGEFGLGLFKYNQDKERGLSLSVLSGFGASTVVRDSDPTFGFNGPQQDPEYQSQFTRFSIQPALFLLDDNIDVTFAWRNSMLYWLNPDEYDGQIVDGFDIYTEPTLSLRAGSPMTKFFFDLGLQVPITRAFRHPINPIHLGVGVSVSLSKEILSQPGNSTPNEQ